MLLFNRRVYKAAVSGTSPDYSSSELQGVLGSTTRLLLQTIVVQSSGKLTLDVELEGSWDDSSWHTVWSSSMSINDASRVAQFFSITPATASGVFAPLQRVKLAIQSSGSMFVEVWAAGRSRRPVALGAIP